MDEQLTTAIYKLIETMSQKRHDGSDNQILTTMNKLVDRIQVGFTEVHTKLNSFKEQFIDHQKACAQLFAKIAEEKAVEEALRRERDKIAKECVAEEELNLKRGINWGSVKTGAVSLAIGVMVLAAIKFLWTNMTPYVVK